MLLIIIGTGMLKPNASTLVGELYGTDEQARRDSGFSIFYAGINLGAAIAPLVTGYFGEKVDWHLGFGLAGVGMVIGVIQYKMTEKYLGSAGVEPTAPGNPITIRRGLVIVVAALAIFVALMIAGVVTVNPVVVGKILGYVIPISAIVYFLYVLLFQDLNKEERKRIVAIAIFFMATGLFYAGYEQHGSSLNVFAKEYTDLYIGSFEMPASWLQSVSPVTIIVFSIVFAWLWVWLDRRNLNPSTPVKLAFGLILMGLGYLVMMGASKVLIGGEKPLPTWLIATFLLHTFGEICLYPVGLSAVTKLSPRKLVGQMMGVYFIAVAYGNLIAGLFVGEFNEEAIARDPSLLLDLFGIVMKVMVISGIIVLIFSKPIRKLMGEIR